MIYCEPVFGQDPTCIIETWILHSWYPGRMAFWFLLLIICAPYVTHDRILGAAKWVEWRLGRTQTYCTARKDHALQTSPISPNKHVVWGISENFFQFSLVDIFLLYVPRGNFVVCWKQNIRKNNGKTNIGYMFVHGIYSLFLITIHMYQIYVSIAWVVCVAQECFTELGVFSDWESYIYGINVVGWNCGFWWFSFYFGGISIL